MNYITLDLPLNRIERGTEEWRFLDIGPPRIFDFIITRDKDKIYIIEAMGKEGSPYWIGHTSVLPLEERVNYESKQKVRSNKEIEGNYETNNEGDYVYLAGQIYYNGKGNFLKMSNWSGHYSMPYDDFLSAAIAISDELPGIQFVDHLVEEREKIEASLDSKVVGTQKRENVHAASELMNERNPNELTDEEWSTMLSLAGV